MLNSRMIHTKFLKHLKKLKHLKILHLNVLVRLKLPLKTRIVELQEFLS